MVLQDILVIFISVHINSVITHGTKIHILINSIWLNKAILNHYTIIATNCYRGSFLLGHSEDEISKNCRAGLPISQKQGKNTRGHINSDTKSKNLESKVFQWNLFMQVSFTIIRVSKNLKTLCLNWTWKDDIDSNILSKAKRL